MFRKILHVLCILLCLSGVVIAILHLFTSLSINTTLLFTYNAFFIASTCFAEIKKKNYLKLCLYLIVPIILYIIIIIF